MCSIRCRHHKSEKGVTWSGVIPTDRVGATSTSRDEPFVYRSTEFVQPVLAHEYMANLGCRGAQTICWSVIFRAPIFGIDFVLPPKSRGFHFTGSIGFPFLRAASP